MSLSRCLGVGVFPIGRVAPGVHAERRATGSGRSSEDVSSQRSLEGKKSREELFSGQESPHEFHDVTRALQRIGIVFVSSHQESPHEFHDATPALKRIGNGAQAADEDRKPLTAWASNGAQAADEDWTPLTAWASPNGANAADEHFRRGSRTSQGGLRWCRPRRALEGRR